MKKTLFTLTTVAGLGIALTGGGISAQAATNQSNNNMNSSMSKDNSNKDSMNMNMDMKMKHKNKLPNDLKKATDPKYKVGSTVKLTADHMDGMKGATAKVTGAYDTPLYVVDYTPTNGGKEVKNHKYVVKSELKGDKKNFKKGDKVTIEAHHMKGMKGAKGKIVKVDKGPAYAVTFTPTNGGEEYVNHKWLSQDEMEAK